MRADRRGLEGMPLQLLIISIIAAVVIGVVLGWLYLIPEQEVVRDILITADGSPLPNLRLTDSDGDGISSADDIAFNVSVKDQNRDPIPGATVVLSGSGVQASDGGTAVAVTDADGIAAFSDLHVEVPKGQTSAISISVEKPDFTGSTTKLPVVG